jgi:hypothetical protein
VSPEHIAELAQLGAESTGPGGRHIITLCGRSAFGISKASIPLWIAQGRIPAPTKPRLVGLPDYWPAEVIADYLPGGSKAPSKRPPGRKPMTRAEVVA